MKWILTKSNDLHSYLPNTYILIYRIPASLFAEISHCYLPFTTEETEPILDEQQPKKKGRISKANRIIDSEEVMVLLRIAKKEVAILKKKLNIASKIYEDFEETKWKDKNDKSISDDYKQKFEDKAWELQNIAIGLENEIDDIYTNFGEKLINGNIKY